MPEESNPSDEPKIIVDDDWKSQVEKEKEALKNPTAETADNSSEQPHELPPPSFMVLLSTLATQAMASLGFIPDPATGQPTVNRPMAKHFIDTLAMLQEKTKGNLTEEESAHLRDALHQLRMSYVSTAPKTQAKETTDETKPTSSIELP